VRFTRRGLLQGLVALFGFDPPGHARWLGGRARAGDAFAAASPDAETNAGRLTREGIEDLVALAEILVADGSLPAGERAYLVQHVEMRTTQGGGYYLSLYRTTVSLLGHLAGTPFSRLEVEERMALVTRHRLNVSELGAREVLGLFPDEMRQVRTRAVPDLVGGYYASPAGWAVVGYDAAFPGRCGDPMRYTRPER